MSIPVPASPPAPVVADIEQFLCEAVAALAPEEAGPRGPGRPRVLPALALWAGLLVCVLHGFSSHLALWRLLTARGHLGPGPLPPPGPRRHRPAGAPLPADQRPAGGPAGPLRRDRPGRLRQ